MSLTVWGNTADKEVALGTTQVIINANSDGGASFIYAVAQVGGTYETQGYYRAVARVSTATTTHYFSAVGGPIALSGDGHVAYPGSITITGLTSNQTYEYQVQGHTTSAVTTESSWGNVPDDYQNWAAYGEGFFTTPSANPNAPQAALSINTTQDGAPFNATLTYAEATATSGPADTLTWNFGDGVTIVYYNVTQQQVGVEPFHQGHVYQIVGTHTATVTGMNIVATSSSTIAFEVTTPIVTASFTYAAVSTTVPGAEGREMYITLTDSSTTNDDIDNPIIEGFWAITGPNTSTASVTSTLPNWNTIIGTNVTAVGSYTITLTVTGNQNVTNSASIPEAFWVSYLPAAAAFTATPLLLVGTQSATFFNDSTGDITTAVWAFGDASTASTTAATTTHSYAATALYTVSLTVTASSTTTAIDSSTLVRTEYVAVQGTDFYSTLGGMLQEIQWHLLGDPDVLPCDGLNNFGGSDNVLSVYYRRLADFLDETQITRTESTLAADTLGVYPLPANLIELNRVEVDGYAMQPMDAKQADLYDSAWETNTTEVYGYIIEPQNSLELRLVPKVTGKTVKVIYVAAVNTATEPSNCITWDPLPIPYSWSWVLKWGVIADLLAAEGEFNDPVRAKFAEELYSMGVELAKQAFRPVKGPQG